MWYKAYGSDQTISDLRTTSCYKNQSLPWWPKTRDQIGQGPRSKPNISVLRKECRDQMDSLQYSAILDTDHRLVSCLAIIEKFPPIDVWLVCFNSFCYNSLYACFLRRDKKSADLNEGGWRISGGETVIILHCSIKNVFSRKVKKEGVKGVDRK